MQKIKHRIYVEVSQTFRISSIAGKNAKKKRKENQFAELTSHNW